MYSSKLVTLSSFKVSSVKAVTVTGISDALSSFLVADTTTSSICLSWDSALWGAKAAIAPKKERENLNKEETKSEIGWGHQIRSYVLQPYRLIKDNRTNFESTNPDKVLDGDIDDFLEKSLYQIKWK